MKRYLGVDLHKDKFTVCYLDRQDKKVIREFRLENLDRFKKTLKPEDEIAIEAVDYGESKARRTHLGNSPFQESL